MPNHRQPHFHPLEQTAFQSLTQSAYLKGFLKPFKGKRELFELSEQCVLMRDQLIELAKVSLLKQAHSYPFSLFVTRLMLQTTGSGTAFLRWRKLDRSEMGVTLWRQLMTDPKTPESLLDDLFAMEQQRITINMQISLLHSIAKQARECADKMACAEQIYNEVTQ